MGILLDFWTSFTLGLLTPLTAVCVLPLYPAFLAYLANQFSPNEQGSRKRYAMFGLLITLGVLIFMFLLGLLFTTIFQTSLTKVIGILSPIAFGILAIISLLLIFNVDFGSFLPKAHAPITKSPTLNALIYGFFFGAIVIPCNPGFIAAFLARTALVTNFFSSMVNFISFGLGLGFPLLVFSLISVNYSQSIIAWLTQRKRAINFLAGIVMLGISMYYLFWVFSIHKILF
jgi:cytochrome c-type biogenesis protein